MSDKTRVRRNLHTYPFKYQYLDPESFFAPERGVAYVHIPFCATRCHFCEYVVYTDKGADAQAAYVDALCEEIRRFSTLRCFPRFELEAVYFGGGTPGLIETRHLVRLIELIRQEFAVTSDCEVAIEFDPHCVEADKLAALHDAGFNRINVGVQAFDDRILKANNRPHTLADCFRAWEIVQNSAFTHTNIDLIYPLIDLDLETWSRSLDQVIAMAPACVTAYPLEVWPGTAYHTWLTRGRKAIPPAGIEVEMCRMAFDRLEAAGFRRLSTSGYFHPERTTRYCRFLDFYWRTWPMLGFGVGSKSVIGEHLWTNVRGLGEYHRRIAEGRSVLDFATRLDRQAEMRRVMIRGLKMCEVSKPMFLERFGVPMEQVFGAQVAELVEKGLLLDLPDRIELTREGQVFASGVWETFYTEDDLRPPREGEVQFGLSTLLES